ncbi:thiamine phosphate synthase [Usitatibacter palustris]|uniref:Thiamine-phosphate synthase n=1 Tax=Usitatibacter palustris TaxID=2732487 RepID=A0A6M4H1N5_9PROT|nr:thiamine phosphate synthase [Usitatibacter palustris]QJR13252.1 Thiamine-phosphate synthase [Usitatibacter palustris]
MTSKVGAPALRGLYAITPETPDTARLANLVDEALAGGATLVQYRAKSLAPGPALDQAHALRERCAGRGLFIVNDSLELALAVNADGVHLGRDDGDVARTREALPGRLVGVSCYDDPERARAAALAGADYVAIGSCFGSSTKPQAVRAPLERIAQARDASGLPVVAIGGITLHNAPLAIAAGADMVAVISALFDAPDVRGMARDFAALFAHTPEPHGPRKLQVPL